MADFIKCQSDSDVYVIDNKPYTRLHVFGKTIGIAVAVAGGSAALAFILAPFAAASYAIRGLLLAIRIGRGISMGVSAVSGGVAAGGMFMAFPLFKKSVKKSKLTGKLLGLAISLGLIFQNQTLSLIGFTLGAETAKSCINTLYACGAHKIVHEIVLIGGLTSFKTKEHETEEQKEVLTDEFNEKIFGSTVSKSISSFYSEEDMISNLYNKSISGAIGTKPRFNQMSNNKVCEEHFVMRPRNDDSR